MTADPAPPVSLARTGCCDNLTLPPDDPASGVSHKTPSPRIRPRRPKIGRSAGDCPAGAGGYNSPIVSYRTVAILMLALLPSAVLNGYAVACPYTLDKPTPELDEGPDTGEKAGAEESWPSEPTDQDMPATGTPVIGLPVLCSAAVDSSARALRTFTPVRSRSLPVGLWHGQALCVPRPFSRLDRVVAMSCCDATTLMRLARHVQPHAPPIPG